MFSRKQTYETSNQGSSLDDLSRKLAVDLRKHVRKLDHYPPYTKDWLGLSEALLHISNIALMEHRVPREGGDDDSTLWEGDELTVRFLLEEGKLNLCLRLMHEYKLKQAELRPKGGEYDAFLGATAKTLDLPDAEQLKARLLAWEQSLGVLLRCAFEHIEAVQTTDLPELMKHAEEVLAAARVTPLSDAEFDRTQETMMLRYLASVMHRAETLGEERVMPQVKQLGIVPLVAQHLHTHSVALKTEGCLAGATFLALVFDTEDYSTYKTSYVTPEVKALLKDFKPLFLAELTAEMEQRRKLRPLLDEVLKAGG